jgi:hypothetical protein
MELLGDMGQTKAYFSPFGDSTNLHAGLVHGFAEHTLDLEIILGAPDGTSR